MSNDKREDILQELLTIAGTVSGIVTTARNRGLNSNEKRPASILIDGDETAVLTFAGKKGMASLMAPQKMEMSLSVFYLPKEKRPQNVDETTAKNIGSIANAWRIEFLEKLWGSVELAELIGSNGSIVYSGCETDLKSGSALSGEIRLDFAVQYFLSPNA